MSHRVVPWLASSLLVFIGHGAIRPAIAAAAPNDEPTVTTGDGSVAPATKTAHETPPAGDGAAPPPPYPAAPPPRQARSPYPPPDAGYPPPKLIKVHRHRRGLVSAGAVTFGVTWGFAASISLVRNTCTDCGNNSKNYLWVPVAGPFLSASSENQSSDNAVLVFWSVAQAAGLVMVAVGMAGHDVLEYRYADRGPAFQLGPLIARDASGMTLTARW